MAGLDPENWDALRALGHRMLDDAFDRLAEQGRGEGPVWHPMPAEARAAFRTALPTVPTDPDRLYARYRELVQPYALNNTHPRFMGWVHGAGTGIGMLADMLAASLDANLGGRDHAPVEVERCVIRWAAEMVGMPADSSGLLVTGSSIANFIAVVTALRAAAGPAIRARGVATAAPSGGGFVGYAAGSAHGCIPRAFDLCGLGTDALRVVPTGTDHRMDVAALTARIRADRAAGLTPFMVCATAGTVDTGAVDDLRAIAALCRRESLWFHVDGAFGALASLSPTLRPLLSGIENADSLAFDFHKWAQVPYDAGCVLVRDGAAQAAAFSQTLAYLTRADRGAAGNAPWFCDLGPDLSRGFRALKVWMTLATYGSDRLGRMVEECCAVARHLAARVQRESALELLAPVTLNVVCFRVCPIPGHDPDLLNEELVKDLHESGIAVPSTTSIDDRRAIRAAVVNHRTVPADADMMLDGLLTLLDRRLSGVQTMPAAGPDRMEPFERVHMP